jgi:hypothetical protein
MDSIYRRRRTRRTGGARGMGRVIVFGDTCFLGRRGVRHLRGAGETVRIASRHPGLDELRDRRSMEVAAAGVGGAANAVSVYVEHGNHIRIAATAKASQLWKFSLDDYVIAGSADDRPRAELKWPWGLITAYAQLDGPPNSRPERHTHAGIGTGTGLGLPIIGKLLGHRHPETTARYAHLDADPLRRASNHIGQTIAAALQKEVAAAEVVAFERRARG